MQKQINTAVELVDMSTKVVCGDVSFLLVSNVRSVTTCAANQVKLFAHLAFSNCLFGILDCNYVVWLASDYKHSPGV